MHQASTLFTSAARAVFIASNDMHGFIREGFASSTTRRTASTAVPAAQARCALHLCKPHVKQWCHDAMPVCTADVTFTVNLTSRMSSHERMGSADHHCVLRRLAARGHI